MIQINAKDALLLADSGHTLTASDVGKNVSTAIYYDAGATFKQRSLITLNVPVGAIDIASTDESYKLRIEQSDTSVFTATLHVDEITIDKAAHIAGNVYTLVTRINARYVRMAVVTAGTTPSIAVGVSYFADNNIG